MWTAIQQDLHTKEQTDNVLTGMELQNLEGIEAVVTLHAIYFVLHIRKIG